MQSWRLLRGRVALPISRPKMLLLELVRCRDCGWLILSPTPKLILNLRLWHTAGRSSTAVRLLYQNCCLLSIATCGYLRRIDRCVLCREFAIYLTKLRRHNWGIC